MAFNPEAKDFSSLKDSVWVLTGGANGIGEQIVKSLHAAGASVVFGDIAEDNGEKLATSLGNDKATFVKMNVLNYADHVTLFKTALEKHGHVDHAIPVAGIILPKENWFGSNLNIEDVEKPAGDSVVDVNLKGTLYFARVALAYLRHGAKPGDNKSLTLTCSVSGFLDSPHIPVYSVSKHGVQGLMRALRETDVTPSEVRVNCINPSFVLTPMTKGFAKHWTDAGMEVNTTDFVAKVVMGLASQTDANGKAIYISENKGWDIEQGLAKTEPEWMGNAFAVTQSTRKYFMGQILEARKARMAAKSGKEIKS